MSEFIRLGRPSRQDVAAVSGVGMDRAVPVHEQQDSCGPYQELLTWPCRLALAEENHLAGQFGVEGSPEKHEPIQAKLL